GLQLSYSCHGASVYSSSVEMSAYRIVQEALTNVTRHAPGAHASLEIAREPDAVTITVTDDGAVSAAKSGPAQPGLGLAGMRERAALHGGEVRAGQLQGGGFEVVAVLPAERRSAAESGDTAA